jgi:hypothetical protein
MKYFKSSKYVIGFSWVHKLWINIFGAIKCETCKRIPTELHGTKCVECSIKEYQQQ